MDVTFSASNGCMMQALWLLLAKELRLNLPAHQFVPQNLPEKIAVVAMAWGQGIAASGCRGARCERGSEWFVAAQGWSFDSGEILK
jgi:hypothetical protein